MVSEVLADKQVSDTDLCYPFSKLFNFILDCSKIPQKWKLGEISPVFKKKKPVLSTRQITDP